MDHTKVQVIHTGLCRSCGEPAQFVRKCYQAGGLLYSADECQNCGDRSGIRRIDPKTLKEVDADGR